MTIGSGTTKQQASLHRFFHRSSATGNRSSGVACDDHRTLVFTLNQVQNDDQLTASFSYQSAASNVDLSIVDHVPSVALWPHRPPVKIRLATSGALLPSQSVDSDSLAQFLSTVLCSDSGRENDGDELHRLKRRESTRPPCNCMPLLKSHLQKSIRRGKQWHAVQSAWSMLQSSAAHQPQSSGDQAAQQFQLLDGWLELVRRLPIIMIEDCSLHATGMPVIVWLMLYLTQLRSRWRQSVEAANDHTAAPPVKRRKFTPSIKVLDHRGLLLLLRWTLGLAEQLCLIPVRDAFMLLQMDEKSTERAVEGILNDLPSSVVENHGADQLLSMRIRRLFGGMRSDLLMFDRACLVWHERLLINDDGVQCAALQQQQPIRLNPEQFRLLVDHLTKTPLKLPSMRPKDWLLAAIDHHVSPIAGRLWRESFTPEDRQLISSTYGCNQHHDDNNDEDELGERFVGDMIWTQSSSVNWRENHSATEEGFLHSEFWRKYRSEFDRLAMEILCRRLYN